MDSRCRDIFAKYVLSINVFSEQQNPRSALITRGIRQLGVGFSTSLGGGYETLPVFEAIIEYYSSKVVWDISCNPILFTTYFPSLEEFIALYSTDIRKIYYMGDITDERTVRFLNNKNGFDIEVIKLELD